MNHYQVSVENKLPKVYNDLNAKHEQQMKLSK